MVGMAAGGALGGWVAVRAGWVVVVAATVVGKGLGGVPAALVALMLHHNKCSMSFDMGSMGSPRRVTKHGS